MMKKMTTLALGLAVAIPGIQSASAEEMVSQWVVDTKGKPPYQRTLKQVPVSDIAQLEAEDYETVTVYHVEMGGKPPYKRGFKTMRVSDVAELEIVEDTKKTDFSGKPPYRRF